VNIIQNQDFSKIEVEDSLEESENLITPISFSQGNTLAENFSPDVLSRW